MDEVQAMTHAGETVGRAMGTGLRTLRRGAVDIGHSGAEAAVRAATAAERTLAETRQELTAGASRRRWPWLLVLLGIAAVAGTVAVLRGRSSTDSAPADVPADSDADEQRISGNGTAPKPRTEQAKRKEFDRKN